MYQPAVDQLATKTLIRERYDTFIGGRWVAPVEGRYFDNPSPVTGKTLCSVPRSTAPDIELALDAAHEAKDAWGRTSVQGRVRGSADAAFRRRVRPGRRSPRLTSGR